MQIGSRTKNVAVEHIVGDVEDQRLREELPSCQHFLVDSELERARHKVFNYAVKTLNETIVNEKLDNFFNKLNCTAKVWPLVSFWKRNEGWRVQILLRTRKKACWIDPYFCAPMTTWQSWNSFATNLTSDGLVAEEKWGEQNGGSTSWQT